MLFFRDYRAQHTKSSEEAKELADTRFRIQSIEIYMRLRKQEQVLGRKLESLRFSEDLETKIARGTSRLSEELLTLVNPTDERRALTKQQRRRILDRVAEMQGLLEETSRELESRLAEGDIARWFNASA